MKEYDDPVAYAERVFPTVCDACKEKMGYAHCEQNNTCAIKKKRRAE